MWKETAFEHGSGKLDETIGKSTPARTWFHGKFNVPHSHALTCSRY
jgi:hypothetical protein